MLHTHTHTHTHTRTHTHTYICICNVCIYIVCDHEIIRAMEFAETNFASTEVYRSLRNFIELLTVISGLMHGF